MDTLHITHNLYNKVMDTKHITNKNITNSLVVVTAKEHGKLYEIKDGRLRIVEYVAEHPPTYSDNEGFFVRAGGGDFYGSGTPMEENDDHNLKRYITAMAQELSEVLKRGSYERVLVFEPEHLKGKVVEHINNPTHIPVAVVAYGNFVEQPFDVLVERLNNYGEQTVDPADPDSVAGEENAEEKRKILEVAQKLRGR